jgi:hypothetical protein
MCLRLRGLRVPVDRLRASVMIAFFFSRYIVREQVVGNAAIDKIAAFSWLWTTCEQAAIHQYNAGIGCYQHERSFCIAGREPYHGHAA